MTFILRLMAALLIIPIIIGALIGLFQNLPWYLVIVAILAGIAGVGKVIGSVASMGKATEEGKADAKAKAAARLNAMPKVES